VLEFDAAGRRISRSPSFAVTSFDFILSRSSDVDEEVARDQAGDRLA
jgi:hypothetical protein